MTIVASLASLPWRRVAPLLLALGAPAVLAAAHPSPACSCAVEGATAYQPTLAEVSTTMRDASSGGLGPDYPAPPQLEAGYPVAAPTAFTIPCVILNAVGYVESGWHQAIYSVPRGDSGPALVSPSCGYGVMQVTSGMRQPGELPAEVQQAIATDYAYNVAFGTKMLGDKWNAMDYYGAIVGDRNPAIAEDWYYAVWAYNSFSFKNNPNNLDYPWPRPPYACDGTQSYTDYPYQELVWGCAANPPSPEGAALWTAVALTLPDKDDIGLDPGWIATPSPSHTSSCALDHSLYLPLASKQ